MLGDLEEEFHRRAARSRRVATRWYWSQAIRTAAWLGARALRRSSLTRTSIAVLGGSAATVAWLVVLGLAGMLDAAARTPITVQPYLATIIFLSATLLGGFIVGRVALRDTLIGELGIVVVLVGILRAGGAPWPHPLWSLLLAAGAVVGGYGGARAARRAGTARHES